MRDLPKRDTMRHIKPAISVPPNAAAAGIDETVSHPPQTCPVLALLGGATAARGRLHALHPTRPGDEGAATGFALAIMRVLDAKPRPILWVQHRAGLAEAGEPYAPGLSQLGLDPQRIVIAVAGNAREALAAAEMGLALPGLSGVVAEMPQKLPATMLKLGQRLALRAEATTTPCLLLHASALPVQMPVATRWMVAAQPGSTHRRDPISPYASLTPALSLDLVKNRFGTIAALSVQWVPHEQRFALFPASFAQSHTPRRSGAAHSRTLAAAPGDGSHRADTSTAAA